MIADMEENKIDNFQMDPSDSVEQREEKDFEETSNCETKRMPNVINSTKELLEVDNMMEMNQNHTDDSDVDSEDHNGYVSDLKESKSVSSVEREDSEASDPIIEKSLSPNSEDEPVRSLRDYWRQKEKVMLKEKESEKETRKKFKNDFKFQVNLEKSFEKNCIVNHRKKSLEKKIETDNFPMYQYRSSNNRRLDNNGNTHKKNGVKASEILFGICSTAGRYLTCERFGNRVSIDGLHLKNKQQWKLKFIKQPNHQQQQQCVAIINAQNFYLAVNRYDECETVCYEKNEEIQTHSLFFIQIQPSGKYVFENVSTKMYLSCPNNMNNDSNVKCTMNKYEWIVQLAIHPLVTLCQTKRQTYAILNEKKKHLECNSNIGWGIRSLLHLEHTSEGCTFRTFDNKYLVNDGTLTMDMKSLTNDQSIYFKLHIFENSFAFQDRRMRFLCSSGPRGILAARAKTCTKEELFSLEINNPIVTLTSLHNEKFVSMKQGRQLIANQSSNEASEQFQLEYSSKHSAFLIRSCSGEFWHIDNNDNVLLDDTKHSNFLLKYMEDSGIVRLQSINDSDEKVISVQSNGYLRRLDRYTSHQSLFKMNIINRPYTILKTIHGFIGAGVKRSQLECNRVIGTTYHIEYIDESKNFNIRDNENNYWCYSEKSNQLYLSDTEKKQSFSINICNHEGFFVRLIMNENGKYVRGEKNGSLTTTTNIEQALILEI
ncbi:hypothetical protein SNEBB_000478 [Seison nebaliae]|nr:hypothetical protein SNEBB_000478 [Seison nebaliae]